MRDPVSHAILKALIFPEPYSHILAEVKAPPKVVGDCLKILIRGRKVTAMIKENGNWKRSFIYNADNLHDYHYQATAAGLGEL